MDNRDSYVVGTFNGEFILLVPNPDNLIIWKSVAEGNV